MVLIEAALNWSDAYISADITRLTAWNVISPLPFLKSQIYISSISTRLTLLYRIPPPTACKTQPVLAITPKTAETIAPRPKQEMVLIKPADPVATSARPSRTHKECPRPCMQSTASGSRRIKSRYLISFATRDLQNQNAMALPSVLLNPR